MHLHYVIRTIDHVIRGFKSDLGKVTSEEEYSEEEVIGTNANGHLPRAV